LHTKRLPLSNPGQFSGAGDTENISVVIRGAGDQDGRQRGNARMAVEQSIVPGGRPRANGVPGAPLP